MQIHHCLPSRVCGIVFEMLSSRTKYGIHALTYLSHKYGKGLIAIRDIAEAERIPRKFLESILLDFKGAGILSSRAGPSGGYTLRVSPRELTLGRVVRLMEGPLALTPCVSQNSYSPCTDCRSEKECSLRLAMKRVRDATAEILDEVSFQSLVDEENQLKGTNPPHSFDI